MLLFEHIHLLDFRLAKMSCGGENNTLVLGKLFNHLTTAEQRGLAHEALSDTNKETLNWFVVDLPL